MIAELDNLPILDAKKKSQTSVAPMPSKKHKITSLSLDFETVYDANYSVKTMGAWAYVNHPRFQATQVAALCDCWSCSCHPSKFDWSVLHDADVIAHNASFDKCVFDRLQELGIVPADVKPRAWYCTSNLSRYLNGPSSLKDCAKVWLGVELDKSIRTRMGTGLPDMFDDVAAYALDDARYCWQLWKLLSKAWPEHERTIADLTRCMGAAGVYVDRSYLESCVGTLGEMIKQETAKLPWVAVGRTALSIDAFKEWCATNNVDAPKSTAKTDAKLSAWKQTYKDTPAPAWLAAMQSVRRANRTLKVFEAMATRIMPHNGRMAYDLLYCGASTGRWAGAGGLNMQNFNRDEVAEGVDLRNAMTAAPGNTLIIIDYSQIESRVLLWLAGDHATLDVLRSGIDIYEAHARTTMGYRDPRPLKDVDKPMRQMAKARVLGLGYGCGAEKFIVVAKIMGGLDITFKDSTRIVNNYRQSNPLITSLWDRLEKAFSSKHGATYRLPLPSGRKLRYYNVDGNLMTGESVKGVSEEWYGGKLTENFVSAVARDVMADAWVKIEAAGMRVVMSVHDELVIECAESQAEACKQDAEEIMRTGPAWADGLPLAVEGQISRRYVK
jgi:DNA polymerase